MKIILLFLIAYPLFAEQLTHDLDGVEITYTYSEGGKYNVKYTKEGVKYRFISGTAPEEWWGPFPYQAFKTKKGEYFLGWYEKGYGDQITHLIDFDSNTLYGSGIIVKKEGVIEHFQAAHIEKVSGLKSRK